MPRLTQEDLDDEIAKAWEAYVKSEQPDVSRHSSPVDVFDLIFDTK